MKTHIVGSIKIRPWPLPQGLQNDTIKERTSIDTLADRLGLMDIQSQDGRQKRPKKPVPTKPGPISTEPGHLRVKQERPYDENRRRSRNMQPMPPQPSRRDSFFMNFSLFGCLQVPDDKPIAPRPISTDNMQEHRQSTIITKQPNARQRISNVQGRGGSPIQSFNISGQRKPVSNVKKPAIQGRRSEIPPKRPSATTIPIIKQKSAPDLLPSNQTQPSISSDPPSKTEDLLLLIPEATTLEIASLLLAELAKPISPHDEEGYIYIFWLTVNALPPTATVAASSLLEAPLDASRPRPGKRRESFVLQTFSSSPPDTKKTVLLKIGRASNVQRRLNEWSRQCGYNVSLIRYYPYHSTSQTLSPVAPDNLVV